MIMKPIDWRVATLFVQERHYSAVMPKLTKHYLGAYVDDELVGVLTLGWGTNPMGTIRKMFAKSISENAIHGSDSDENAKIECDFHFSSQEIF